MTSLLDSLTFDNRFTDVMPGDDDPTIRPRQVPGKAFSRVEPVSTEAPELVSVSQEVADLLGLTDAQISSEEFRDVVSGNLVLPGMDPYAMRYGGHQFGNWAGQLGDGRAMNLGELETPDRSRMTLQLKGAGPTPYSRSADGLAVLRSSVREYLCSEAMHHLGVPTTRALSLALTGDRVLRDMLYDGHPEYEKGAVVCRVAPNFIRFGNFEIFAAFEEHEQLRSLAEFTIREHFGDLWPASGQPTGADYLAFFERVVADTIEMIVHWQRVGFVHGVMNTDNMSILGLTIDYGPYGWLEDYDPEWTPNTTDRSQRRYRYGNQPGVGQWNLLQLANALYPLIGEVDGLTEVLNAYPARFDVKYRAMMRAKLGFEDRDRVDDPSLAEQDELATALVELLSAAETDMTLLYRALADVPLDDIEDGPIPGEMVDAVLEPALYKPEIELTGDLRTRWADWLDRYRVVVSRWGIADVDRKRAMNEANPKFVLRNYLAQLAIDAADEGDFSKVDELLDTLRTPYDEQPEREHLAQKRPEWARTRVGCSMLSCSS